VRREELTVAERLPTRGGEALGQSPFAALDATGLKSSPVSPSRSAPEPAKPERNRGRVDITREKGGRGGKTVTVVDGFTGIGLPEKEQLMKKVRSACGCGGTVKDGRIEIQGDQRDTVARILTEAGFRPVFAGG
jgi:translation initiation factor 1